MGLWLIPLEGGIDGILGEGISSLYFKFESWTSAQGYVDRVRNGFLQVGMNVSKICTAIEAGIQVGGIRDLVFAVYLISSMFM